MCRGQSHRVPKGPKTKLNLNGRPQPEQLKLKSDKGFALWFGDVRSFSFSCTVADYALLFTELRTRFRSCHLFLKLSKIDISEKRSFLRSAFADMGLAF